MTDAPSNHEGHGRNAAELSDTDGRATDSVSVVPYPVAPPGRDVAIDVLRGLAVFTMVAANLAASVLAKPHPFWFRFYGSFAAPLFVLLAGMMVAYTTRRNGYGPGHFLARGAVVIVAAALSEVLVWQVWPFTSIDVLYLIGVALPLAHLSLRLGSPARWAILVVIFLIAPALRQALGYTDYPTTVYLWGEPYVVPEHPTGVLNHWLVDGWFPLLPWLGFALLGVQLAGLRPQAPAPASDWQRKVLPWGATTLVCGVLLWWLSPGGFLTRGDYTEVFYPPTTGYVLTAVGLILILFATVDRNPRLAAYRPLRPLGESALLLYLLHFVLIKFVISSFWPEEPFASFLVLYAALVFALLAVAYGLRVVKARWRRLPLVARVLLGG